MSVIGNHYQKNQKMKKKIDYKGFTGEIDILPFNSDFNNITLRLYVEESLHITVNEGNYCTNFYKINIEDLERYDNQLILVFQSIVEAKLVLENNFKRIKELGYS